METVTDTTELTPEPTLELEPHEPEHTNGHAEVMSKSRAKRHAIQAPPSEETRSADVFSRLADNLRELEAEENLLRSGLSAIVDAKTDLLTKLTGVRAVAEAGQAEVIAKALAKLPNGAQFDGLRDRALHRWRLTDAERSSLVAELLSAVDSLGAPPSRKRGRSAKVAASVSAKDIAAARDRMAAKEASLTAKPRKRSGAKRHRRTAAELSQGVDDIVTLVGKNKKGLGAEAIREALKFDRKAIPQLLAMALEAKRLVKTGQKRSTLYTVKK